MPNIIYYVATSLDGFIAGDEDDVSRFAQSGNGVDKYLKDLQDFNTVIMGRRTYEFGYQFGLQPGQPAYPHMEHYIFSDSMQLENCAENVHVVARDLDKVREIREQPPTDVYLCGGGVFAGWLLDHGLVDQLKLKVNPITLGGGIRLFGESTTQTNWELVQAERFEQGLQILTYDYKS
jgi:dihydrofolate reductase